MTQETPSQQLALYYSPRACSLAPHIALELSGLPYRAVPVNLRAGENRLPGYLEINPAGTVPALRIDDQMLTESEAIMTFVADQVPALGLLPAPGTLARARAHEWMCWVSGSLHVAYRAIFRPESYGGASEAGQRVVSDQGHVNLKKLLGVAEDRLGDAPYALGDSLSVVDVQLFVYYLWAFDERLGEPMPALPRLSALADRVWQRDAVRTVIARERLVRNYSLPSQFKEA